MGVLVRTPAAVEALGRVEVNCLDKTDTLTGNRLTVKVAHACPGVTKSSLLAAAALASPAIDDEHVTRHSTDTAVAEYCAARGLTPSCLSVPGVRSAGLSGVALARCLSGVPGVPGVPMAGPVQPAAPVRLPTVPRYEPAGDYLAVRTLRGQGDGLAPLAGVAGERIGCTESAAPPLSTAY